MRTSFSILRRPLLNMVTTSLLLCALTVQRTDAQCQFYPQDRGRFALVYDDYAIDVTIQFFPQPLRTALPIGRYRIFLEASGGTIPSGHVPNYHQFRPKRDVRGNAEYELIHTGPMAIGCESVTADSQWFEIITGFTDSTLPPRAWIHRSDVELLPMRVQTWPDLYSHGMLMFLCDSTRRFYSRPEEGALITPYLKTFDGDTQPDYSMVPLHTEGNWMKVQLYSPDIFGSDDAWIASIDSSSHPSVSVWIKYLDDRGRPTVFPMTE